MLLVVVLVVVAFVVGGGGGVDWALLLEPVNAIERHCIKVR